MASRPKLVGGTLVADKNFSTSLSKYTLNVGDDILIDLSDGGTRLRDGICVLRMEDSRLVKRLTVHPFGKTVTVQSDNPAYPDCKLDTIFCVGRVIWAGRKVV